MKKLRRYGLSLVASVSLVSIVLLLTGWGSAVAANVSSVFVTNDAAHAVPVAQQGTAQVQVMNPQLQVAAAGTPVATTILESFLGGGQSYIVPAGKRLVINYINGTSAGNQLDLVVSDGSSGLPVSTYAFAGTPTDPAHCSNRCAAYIFGGQVQITASANDIVGVGDHSILGAWTLNGYLIDAP